VRAATLRYYGCLRAVLRNVPRLRKCLRRCGHCRIFFFTDPRNAGRSDLRCPFGCREAHRKARSSLRSVAYYRTAAGRCKKKALNGQRSSRLAAARASPSAVGDGDNGLALLLSYLCLVLTLLERRPVGRDELLPVLRRTMRQHSIDSGAKAEYLAARRTDRPP
jgi:hypothetical protein